MIKTEKEILSDLLVDEKYYLCRMCRKSSLIQTGWHLDNGLNFCSNECVIKYLEKDKLYTCINKKGQFCCSHKINEECEHACHGGCFHK